MIRRILLLTTVFILLSVDIFSQWFAKQTLNSTVLIEKIEGRNFVTHGTGFIMYNYQNQSKVIIVTCAHLVHNKKQLAIRLNPDSSIVNYIKEQQKNHVQFRNTIIAENSLRIVADLNQDNLFVHPKLDIAAFYISIPLIERITDTGNVEIKTVNLKPIPRSLVSLKDELHLGDETYFIGFPLGYGVTRQVEPIVRSGSVAWLPNDFDFFLLDAFSYGGNSGSPIFQKVMVGSKPGNLSWNQPKLMGMIVGHQSIKLENVLNQPDPNQLKFEKSDLDLNIGLARCVYMDDILETIKGLHNIK